MESLKQNILDFVDRMVKEEGRPPSLAKIQKELGLSARKIYEAFPGGLTEICESLGVSVPEDRFKVVSKALKAKKEAKIGLNNLKAEIFRMLEDGEQPQKIVINLKADPKIVEECYNQWIKFKEKTINKTANQKIEEIERKIQKILEDLEGIKTWIILNHEDLLCPQCQEEIITYTPKENKLACKKCGFTIFTL